MYVLKQSDQPFQCPALLQLAKFVPEHTATSAGWKVTGKEISPWVKHEQEWQYCRQSSPFRPHKLNFCPSYASQNAQEINPGQFHGWQKCFGSLQTHCISNCCLSHSQWQYELIFHVFLMISNALFDLDFHGKEAQYLFRCLLISISSSTVLLAAQQIFSLVPNKFQLRNNFSTCFQLL